MIFVLAFIQSHILAVELIDKISRLPLFLQVIIAVIVVGLAFAILKKVVKFAIWLVVLLLLLYLYIMYGGQ